MSFNEEYKKIKKLITAELDIIEQKMVEPIDIQEPLKTHVINFLKAPSKRIRPALAVLLSKALGEELTDEQIKIKDASINPKILKETAFNLYKEIQIAWMNFDNDTLRKNTTHEMYNMYTSQLKTLQLKKQQNTMEN